MNSGWPKTRLGCLTLCLVAVLQRGAAAQTNPARATRQSDVIYGRKFGVALTTEVFTPAPRNGFGGVWVVSSSGPSRGARRGWTCVSGVGSGHRVDREVVRCTSAR
jgi:hypothetical protein